MKITLKTGLVQTLINDLGTMEKAKFETLQEFKKYAKVPKKIAEQIKGTLDLIREANQKQQTLFDESKALLIKKLNGVEDEEEKKAIQQEIDKSYFEKLEKAGIKEMQDAIATKMNSDVDIELSDIEYNLLKNAIEDNFKNFKMTNAQLDELTEALDNAK